MADNKEMNTPYRTDGHSKQMSVLSGIRVGKIPDTMSECPENVRFMSGRTWAKGGPRHPFENPP